MLNKNEKTILRLIKAGPLFVIVFAIIITLVMIQKNNFDFKKEINQIKQESLENKKELLKFEIQRVYDYIYTEKQEANNNIKEELKQRIYNAHTIASSIYQKNQDKPKTEITKLIKDALSDIRYDEGKGYLFIYDIYGVNILHPITPKLEGKNIIDFKDKKGNYPVKEMLDLTKISKEGYITWWWTRKNHGNKEFKKIGFAKNFKPLNWVIATGEYIVDHEEKLKKEILKKINNIKYGENSYIFAYDYDGTTLSHIKKSLLGKNRYDLKDKNGNYLVQDIIKIAKKGEGFIRYVGTIKPTTGKPAEKISFVKGLDEWRWLIGTGTYISELEQIIKEKKENLDNKNSEQIYQILLISGIIFIFIFILSIFFSKTIENRFKDYKNEILKRKDEVEKLNSTLEHKVQERTNALKESNIKLKETLKNLSQTKEDLIVSEKMAMLGELVGNITHEINSPLGMGITSITHIESMVSKITKQYNNGKMTEENFETFLNDLKELSKIISINLNNTSKLVNSFKNVAVDQAVEEKREFNLKNYINEIILSLKSKTKKTKLHIEVSCDDNIILNSYPNYVFQILTNLINNSILHGFEKDEKGKINIVVNDLNNEIKLVYKDNGKGIEKDSIENIFEQYFTTKRGKGGTGLGLYIIKKIVEEKLSGHIKFDSTLNNGVEFTITVPKEVE